MTRFRENRDRYNGRAVQGDNNLIGWSSQIIEIQDSGGSGTGYYRTIVSSQDAEAMTLEMQHNYDGKAFSSYDCIIGPISMDGEGDLPRFCQGYTPVLGTIGLDDLNPLTNPQGRPRSWVSSSRSDTSTVGHGVDMVARTGTGDNNTPEGGLILNVAENVQTPLGPEEQMDYEDDYKFHALRGPIMIHSWCYDCDGNPVPNKNDTETNSSQGVFINTGEDPNKFLDGHLRKPKTWPVAPLDLRLDKTRNVFVVNSCSSGGADCESIKLTFNYPNDGKRYVPIFDDDGTCMVCELVLCGDIMFELGDPCVDNLSQPVCDPTPKIRTLLVSSVDVSVGFDNPNGNIKLIQDSVNSCLWKSNITLDGNNYTWNLIYNPTPDNWNLTLVDDATPTPNTVVSFSNILGSTFVCLGDNTFNYAGQVSPFGAASQDFSTGFFCATV